MKIKAYISIFKMRFLMLLQYRTAAAAGLFTNFFFGMVQVMVFAAFYGSGGGEQPLTFAQAAAYIWLGQCLIGLMPWGGDREIQGMIKSGNVAYELCRPMGLYRHWFVRAVALRTAPTLLRAFPLAVIVMFFMPDKYALMPPVSLGGGAAFAVSLVGTVLISAALTNIISIATLWTVSGEGVARLLPALVLILSGNIVPLPFFPDWIQPFLRLLPFSGLFDMSFKFYIGNMPPEQIGFVLLHQLTWTLLLALFGEYLLRRAMRRVVIQGG